MSQNKYTIGDLQKYAAKHGGKCLSEKYEGLDKELLWECKEKHQWLKSWRNIMRNNLRCEKCTPKFSKSIIEMRILAKKSNGICLSEEYSNSTQKLKWQCKEGHIWTTFPLYRPEIS